MRRHRSRKGNLTFSDLIKGPRLSPHLRLDLAEKLPLAAMAHFIFRSSLQNAAYR